MLKILKYAGSILLATTVVFCSSADFSSTTLANQGMLPLSSTNPHLGTNLYLARQAENSRVLYNFLESRGGPTAIELIDKKFAAPRLILYYFQGQEAFSAELEEQDDSKQWIVKGPFAVKRHDYSTLARIASTLRGEPLFYVNGRNKRFKIDRELALATPTPLPTLIPTPMPTRRPAPKKVKAPVITAPKETVPAIADFKPLNIDQQAIQMAKGYAERADNGDIIHTVKSDGEQVSSIAKWYTGSETNGKEILQLNNIDEAKALVKGQRIIIPLKLLKNLKAMQ